jgi:hypothetical protein
MREVFNIISILETGDKWVTNRFSMCHPLTISYYSVICLWVTRFLKKRKKVPIGIYGLYIGPYR